MTPAGRPLHSVVGVAIVNQRGLHARAAAKFVRLTEQFDAQVTVSKGGTTVSGTSIMGLLMLAASQGSTVDLAARGLQAEAALAALVQLVADRFGED